MKTATRFIPRTTFGIGMTFLAITAVIAITLAYKAPILTKLRSGDTITAEFSSSYRLRPNESKVKVSGLHVGVVRNVEYTDRGTAIVSMKVDEDALATLGSKPSAVIAPLTILGGVYSVELRPGGGSGPFTGKSIPVDRTNVPVELDRILETLPGDTRTQARRLVKSLDSTLKTGGSDALKQVAEHAPRTMVPATETFTGLQGTRPGTDLSQVVSNFDQTATVLNRDPQQLRRIIRSLAATSRALADGSGPLAEGLDVLPSTLRESQTGLTELKGTLGRLEGTARKLRPAAEELGPLLAKTQPVLRQANPLMADLQPLMKDAQPLMRQLVPVAQQGTAILDDINGPVLDRVNGPFTDTVMNTWRGTGPYEGNGAGPQADHKFYEELAYLGVNMDRSSMTQDAQGSMLGFQVGAGLDSVAGLPFNLQNLLDLALKNAGGSR